MKKYIYMVLCMVGTNASGQVLRDSVMIRGSIFNAVYSEVLQQPKRVWYVVQCPTGSYPRAGMDFYGCDSVRASDGKDYEANVWDKGHCAPAADFNCDRARLWATFSYLNCVLQHERLNRGAWRLLEVRERELAKTTRVEVEIRVVFSKGSLRLPTGAVVPDGFWKEIKYSGNSELYYFRNEDPKTTDFRKFLVW